MESLESRMEEELIEAVRIERCLYDSKHPDYMKSKLKESIWNQIATDLKFKNGKAAKKTWEKLRNNHRDALRRRKLLIHKGKTGMKVKPWRFQENMAFLLPHMGKGLTVNDPYECMQNEESAVYLETGDFGSEEYLLEIDSDQEFQANEESNESSELSSTDLTPNLLKKRRRRNRNSNFLLNRSGEEDEKVAKRHKECQGSVTSNDVVVNNVKNDPLFHFFISMYETTKTLPPLSQHTIKKNIFSLVSNEESKNLMQDASHTTASVTPKSEEGTHYSSITIN